MNLDRRHIILGGVCVAAAATSEILRPRRRVTLLGNRQLNDLVPTKFGGWVSHDVNDLVAPKEEGSLASRLYGQTVGRAYTDDATGAGIMMLLAYGGIQSDDLQLHRPEVCYPAFGFSLSNNRVQRIALPGGSGALPARKLTADAPGRRENIVYWSRLGEFLPVSGSEQRADRLKTSMQGIVADGLLARFSTLEPDPARAWALVETFIVDLISATPASGRSPLIGTALSAQMAKVLP